MGTLFFCSDTEKETEFEAMLREEKMQAVNHAMNTLKKGQDEAKVREDLQFLHILVAS